MIKGPKELQHGNRYGTGILFEEPNLPGAAQAT